MFMIVRLESNNVSNISDLEVLNSFLNAINSTCNNHWAILTFTIIIIIHRHV